MFLVILQLLLITDTHGSASRRRRRRRQTSGSLYGTNAGLGSSAPAGYNYPANTNFDGIHMNNLDARDLYQNSLFSSSVDHNPLQSVNLYGLPRQPQDQVFGTNGQSSPNALFSGSAYYPGSAGGSSLFPSNTEMGYPPNPNQVLATKDFLSPTSNINNNLFANNRELSPNRNTYFGSMDVYPNRNSWSNTNTVNRYNQNAANGWPANRNNNKQNSNAYYYNGSYRLAISYFIFVLSLSITMFSKL
ncbi:unnamed protein product [Rotaria magnacalcarata]|nr:unnamed protein product [Rotaria magnacalcarata]CAF2083473.1 unnamed protein product [Rotaria magnacalcarata]CAF2129597.1 unnamed protein product [Rotaria magnacalcarata]CAF3865638.1 unnamed protein product [Rotaria magnacalcarata]CAF4040875.1 unnamed protein product [Rotaria magnacalcarata]